MNTEKRNVYKMNVPMHHSFYLFKNTNLSIINTRHTWENVKTDIREKTTTVGNYSLTKVCLFFHKRVYHRLPSVTHVFVVTPLTLSEQMSRKVIVRSCALQINPKEYHNYLGGRRT